MREEICKELAKHPQANFEFVPGGKHPRVVLSYKGRSRFVPFSSTRTDYRGLRNSISQIRRELRTLGVIR